MAGRVFRDRVEDDGSLVAVATYQVPGTVGAIAPIEGDEGWLLAAGRGFVHLAVDGTQRTLADVAPEGTRMNDAACDPLGRFWAGTKAHDNRAGAGALYRLERDGHAELMLDGLTISNGIGWSPDGGTMYLADTVPRVIHAFSFDLERGTISDGRILVTVSDVGAGPDGLTVDAAGDIWVAIFGGGRVQRYSPDGVLRQELLVPATQTTSCAFAGRGSAPAVCHDRDRGLEPRRSVAPTLRRASSIASRPMRWDARQHRIDPTQRGGAPPSDRRSIPASGSHSQAGRLADS